MGKTAILAVASGYTPEQVKPWVESLKRSAYNGKVFIIMYETQNGLETELANYFEQNGFHIFVSKPTGETHIATQRFLDYAKLLESEQCSDVDMVIHTDIRDVIFQEDPSIWVKDNIQDYQLIATSEGITFRHEDWGGEAIEKNFGTEMFHKFADRETICSGIIAGKKKAITELFKTVYDLAFYSQDPEAFIDQIFYAIAIYEIYNDITKIVPATLDWCANLGTLKAIPENMPTWSTGTKSVSMAFERFRKNKTFAEAMKCNIPIMKDDGLIYADNGKPFSIVHQYDRYQPWSIKIHSRLAEYNNIEQMIN